MDNIHNVASNTSNTSSTPETGKDKKTVHRRKLVKRSKDSFRPGSAASAAVVRKALKFIIPSGTGITNDQEMMATRGLAVQLSKAAGVEVDAVGFHDHAWEIVLKLQPAEGEDDDDKLVSDAFRKLDDTIKASAVLQDGFQPMAPPRWTFNIGDFVADHGGF
ncbi:MAG: hypothetical protein WCE58_12330 [Gallionella sp.]